VRSGAVEGYRGTIEWPTMALVVVVYGGWLGLTYAGSVLPWWILTGAGAVLIALHSSLQHEILHGHPTRFRAFNRMLGFPPLSLWMPYELYRRSHLVHHRDERLTDPLDDPESYYWTSEDWQRIGAFGQLLVKVQTSLAGRVIIGPAWNILRFLYTEMRLVFGPRHANIRVWANHLIGVVVVLLWLTYVCHLSITFYVFGIVYPGTSILLIRSFAEHRARDGVFERTAIVENAPVLGFLFLYNNLHAAHHAEPMMPWYEIPAWYKANRERLIRENGGLVYDGYLDVARRFLFKSHDRPEHPTDRAPLGNGALP
jgi:fatty acid desaturase